MVNNDALARAERPPHAATTGAISLREITKSYGTGKQAVHALRPTTFDVAAGDFVSILGQSGCGKTTLLKIIGDILEPSSGDVSIDNRPAETMRKAREIGYVFQSPVLLPWRTVRQNVQLPYVISRNSHRKGEIQAEIDSALEFVGLTDFSERLPGELSGGMQSRVALARALVYNPRVLLMDEPFASLDELTRTEMAFHLLKIWERIRTTVIFVTHHIQEAVLLSNHVLVLSERPGTIKRSVEIPLPRPRSLETRSLPLFHEICEDLVSDFHQRA